MFSSPEPISRRTVFTPASRAGCFPPRRRPEVLKAARIAYRRDVLGLPSPLDAWLSSGLSDFASPPALDNNVIPGAPLSGNPFVSDYVMCKVVVHRSEVCLYPLLLLCLQAQ